MAQVVVIGGGPAGLMAAEVLATAGHNVRVFEAKPSPARKLLMAGKSGLNLTMNCAQAELICAYWEGAEELAPALQRFDASAVMAWAEGLGVPLFTGPTGRVFPKVMKASPLLRAWLKRLESLGVTLHTRWRWIGGVSPEMLQFNTPDGPKTCSADAVVFALGGASWPHLGSDGSWFETFANANIGVSPFAPSNMGVVVNWSPHMARQFGSPLKNIRLSAGDYATRGEIVVSAQGIEGGGIYALSPALRTKAPLIVDLAPDLTHAQVLNRLSKPKGKQTFNNFLRKSFGFEAVKLALLQEFARDVMNDTHKFADQIKALTIPYSGVQGIARAISTAGGVRFDALNSDLSLRGHKGVFCAGEMLDWDAPTGGYLLTASFATGAFAAQSAVAYLEPI